MAWEGKRTNCSRYIEIRLKWRKFHPQIWFQEFFAQFFIQKNFPKLFLIKIFPETLSQKVFFASTSRHKNYVNFTTYTKIHSSLICHAREWVSWYARKYTERKINYGNFRQIYFQLHTAADKWLIISNFPPIRLGEEKVGCTKFVWWQLVTCFPVYIWKFQMEFPQKFNLQFTKQNFQAL